MTRDDIIRMAQEEQAEPVGWLTSPHGRFRANPLWKLQGAPQVVDWRIPLYTAPPALEQQEQEPVAWMVEDHDGRHFIFRMTKPAVREGEKLTPLYTHPAAQATIRR